MYTSEKRASVSFGIPGQCLEVPPSDMSLTSALSLSHATQQNLHTGAAGDSGLGLSLPSKEGRPTPFRQPRMAVRTQWVVSARGTRHS